MLRREFMALLENQIARAGDGMLELAPTSVAAPR
jgi:hypothetical protein